MLIHVSASVIWVAATCCTNAVHRHLWWTTSRESAGWLYLFIRLVNSYIMNCFWLTGLGFPLRAVCARFVLILLLSRFTSWMPRRGRSKREKNTTPWWNNIKTERALPFSESGDFRSLNNAAVATLTSSPSHKQPFYKLYSRPPVSLDDCSLSSTHAPDNEWLYFKSENKRFPVRFVFKRLGQVALKPIFLVIFGRLLQAPLKSAPTGVIDGANSIGNRLILVMWPRNDHVCLLKWVHGDLQNISWI